jgi:hypothetical protein
MSRFRFLIALVFVAAPVAWADAVYTYTGAPFDTIMGDPLYLANPPFKLGDSIDLIVDFSAPLAPGLVDQTVTPVSWSYKIGSGGFLPGSTFATLLSSTFSTGSSGKIDDWFFSVFDSPRGFSTSGTAGDEAHQFAAQLFAGTTSTETIGTWTAPAEVPEPSSLSLLIPGLAALFLLVKRRSHAWPLRNG